jgi:hypothetical protein
MIDEPYINLLAEKAQAKVQSRENGTYDTRRFNLEFARLIIDICADVVEDFGRSSGTGVYVLL